MCSVSPISQTLSSMTTLEVLRRPLQSSHVYVHDEATIGLQLIFFFLPYFSPFALDFMTAPPKIKCVLSICICINFDPYSFNYYLFSFNAFFN